MASSAGSIALALEDGNSICGSNLSPDTGFSRSERREWQQRAALIRGRRWKPRKEESCPRSRQRMHHTVERSHCREETARAGSGTRCDAEKVRVRRERELAVAQERRFFAPPSNRARQRGLR